MLTKLTMRNFKVFDDVQLELGNRVVLMGPNNAGKTTALQALALWDIGVKRWTEKRGAGEVPAKRPGVTINRRDLIAVPVPAANLLWRDTHVREGSKSGTGTKNVRIEIIVEGVSRGRAWECGLEFDYANEESFYCRTLIQDDGNRMQVPNEALDTRIAYLPPMSGLAANEARLDQGAVNVRLGEGRTAEVLRNLCYQILEGNNGNAKWEDLVNRMRGLFGVTIEQPSYIKERGEIVMTYLTRENIRLDLSASGRGQQQTLLLLAHMIVNPGALLLLDEPDAHLEILRQRQIYDILTQVADSSDSQIIAASHSEVILNEAADRDIVIAFLGKPHRIDDRGKQVGKALKEIGFEHYYQAESTGWVLYLEGATDLAILRALAERLQHRAYEVLDRPFVHYVGNQPSKAFDHFYGLREAVPDLVGLGLFDSLESRPAVKPDIKCLYWKKREIENYICYRETLMEYARENGEKAGDLFISSWQKYMDESISEIEKALKSLERPDPWSSEIKASDDFLDPLFNMFFGKLDLPNLMRKTDYHSLVRYVPVKSIDSEVSEKLDAILEVAKQSKVAN